MKKIFTLMGLLVLLFATAMHAETNSPVSTKSEPETRCTRSGTIETSGGSISISITAQSCAEADAAFFTLATTFAQL